VVSSAPHWRAASPAASRPAARAARSRASARNPVAGPQSRKMTPIRVELSPASTAGIGAVSVSASSAGNDSHFDGTTG
jgi:hypothetical protein